MFSGGRVLLQVFILNHAEVDYVLILKLESIEDAVLMLY